MSSQQLKKAQLYCLDGDSYTIPFMFNPTQLAFSRGIKLNQPSGSSTKKGQPKVNFAEPDPCVLTLSKILFDTYEEEKDVLKQYLEPLIKAVKFLDTGTQGGGGATGGKPASQHSQSTQQKAQNKRPPIYLFTWGDQQYMRCFVESLKYQLTLFLPDGTPVRAVVDLTLKEVDESVGPADPRAPKQPDRTSDSRSNKRKK